MDQIKIVEFNPQGPGLFCRQLEFLAKEQQWNFHFINFPEFQVELLAEADLCKVDSSLSSAVLAHLQYQPDLVRTLQAVDFIVKEQNKWFPRNFLYQALRKNLVEKGRGIDSRDPAFIVGYEEEAVVAAAVLVNMGFQKIYITGNNLLKLKEKTELLLRAYFGVQFFTIPSDHLTAQTIGAGVVINTMKVDLDKDLLRDMSYFNFMRRNGYVIDINMFPYPNPLLEEAERAALRVVYPIHFAAQETFYCLENLGLLGSLKVEDLEQSWEKFLIENFDAEEAYR